MTAKSSYKKELFSLPAEVAEELNAYAKETHRKKSHIVAEAIREYVKKKEEDNLVEEALNLIGVINNHTQDIQEIKANREDI